MHTPRSRSRVVYLVTCLLCGQGYRGTTGHSLHKRSCEHMYAVRKGNVANAVGKHFHNEHPGVGREEGGPQVFRVEILGGCRGNLERFVEEGVFIEEGVKEGRGRRSTPKGSGVESQPGGLGFLTQWGSDGVVLIVDLLWCGMSVCVAQCM